MHGSNRLGGNSLSDLLVFGRRAGAGAVEYIDGLAQRPALNDADVQAAEERSLAPFGRADGGESPYGLHHELQAAMNELVGIIRTESEVAEAVTKIEGIKQRAKNVGVQGGRAFNPGWHLALDLRNMLVVSEAIAKAALLRQESRGGHTRDDYPGMNAEWRRKLLVCTAAPNQGGGDDVTIVEQDQIPMRPDLLDLFELDELKKYLTEAELPGRENTGAN
jgi:succinate dehydrogenase / fumarate reductase flavoprotein subunit